MRVLSLAAIVTAFALSAARAEPTVEVLHLWTTVTNHDAAAAANLKAAFEKAGGRWIDTPIPPNGIDQVTQARFLAGNPPAAVTMHAGPNIDKWAAQGALADISDVARAEHWDKLLPAFIMERISHEGRVVAVPVGTSRLSFMLASPVVLKKAGVKVTPGWPRDWDEFNAAAEKIKKAGLVPLAMGPAWMEGILFRSVVLGLGGPQFYRKAVIELDPEALSSPTMVRVFDQMRRLQGYSNKDRLTRPGPIALMIGDGTAGMMIVGDWTKMNLFNAGKKPGQDFLCLDSPGSAGSFIAGPDALALFKSAQPDVVAGQKLLARVVMSRDAQERFSIIKGSIPLRLDVPTGQLDPCTRKNVEDFRRATRSGTVLEETGAPGPAAALRDVVSQHFNSDMSSQEAVKLAVEAARNAR